MAAMKQHNAVLYVGTNKSEEYGASIFRVEQTLNIETAGSFQMLVPVYQTTRFHVAEDHELTARTNENFCFSRSRKRVNVISRMFLPEGAAGFHSMSSCNAERGYHTVGWNYTWQHIRGLL